MKDKAVLKLLSHLVQLDIDAIHAYKHTIEAVDDEVVRERLAGFRDNHEQHVESLRNEIETMGGDVPDASPDFKGYIMEGAVTLGAVAGMEGALKVIKIVEEITHQAYSDAVSRDIPAEVKEIIRRHFSDEKIHLDYIVSNS